MKKGETDILKRDTTPMPSYYKAWDKFDVEKALESSDEEGEKKKVNKIGPIKY